MISDVRTGTPLQAAVPVDGHEALISALVGQRQRVQHVGNGEDRMKIDDSKHLLFSGQYPFFSGQRAAFGAVTVPAGVVKRPLVSALVAAVQAAPKTGRPALDYGVHGLVRL